MAKKKSYIFSQKTYKRRGGENNRLLLSIVYPCSFTFSCEKIGQWRQTLWPICQIDSIASKRTQKRKPDGTDQENAIMHDCSLRVIVLLQRNEPQSTETSRNSWGVFIPYPFFQ